MRLTQEEGSGAGPVFEELAEAACFGNPGKQEGVEAFLAKRKPQLNK